MDRDTTLQGKLRLQILDLHFRAGSGHIGCSLSCIDMMACILHYLKQPEDRFILSKGHAASALYTILSETGHIPPERLSDFYGEGTSLPAHPAPLSFPSILFATGSLGHGLPLATGIAKANKLKKQPHISYVLMSDGETNEGTTWEAAHFAVAHGLNNLVVFIDKNGLQGFGSTKEIMGDTASKKVWEEIGFEVCEADGHNLQEMATKVKELLGNKSLAPKLVIANTIKGKGIAYMEDKMEWHYLPMNNELYAEAVQEIKTRYQLT